MSQCTSCGAGVVFAKNVRTGATMIFDAEREEGGRWLIEDRLSLAGDLERVATYDAAKDVIGRVGYVAHFATCPQAHKHRSSRHREPA